MIYIDKEIGQFDLAAALAEVSEQRREQALRFRQEHDQRLSVAAYRLLCKALLTEYGITEQPLFTYDDHGKPSIVGHPDIFFNLSHCHEAVACVIGNRPVGIDVESYSNYYELLVPAVMNEQERRQILYSPDPRLSFLRLWTMKESLLKMTGKGIADDMRDVLNDTSNYRFHTTIYPLFVCTVCQEGRGL